MTAPFIGREPELRRLRSFFDSPVEFRITAIHGRQRIGKTRLVEEAYGEDRVLRFDGLEAASSAEQRRHFRNTLYRHTRLEAHRTASTGDWTDLLLLLAEHVAQDPCVIFFDEFQWMAAGRKELVSRLKYVWDSALVRQSRAHLILCGSVSSFMVDKVIRSSALHGRIDDIIALGPLDFPESRAGFLARRGVREALETYLIFGGVPKYLELLDTRHAIRLNLANLCFSPGGYFVDEVDRLFVSHFGKVRHYRNIVEFLVEQRFATRTQIARQLGMNSGGRLTEMMDNLCLAGLVEAYSPVHKPQSTYLRRYRLADPYLRFYSRFILPARARISRSKGGVPLHQALPEDRYRVFQGLAFEHFCHQHAQLLARKLGFSAISYEAGSWYRRADLQTGAQIDLLFVRADHVTTLCEVKFREHVGREVIDEVERKVAALSASRGQTVERVLISALPPAEGLAEEGYFSQILTADDLLDATPVR